MRINATYIEPNAHVIGGRVGIVLGLVAFVSVYILMLVQFGWVAGIAIGWLPAALAGWLVAMGCDSLVTHLLRGSPVLQSSSPKS